jgi:hypothetical protein
MAEQKWRCKRILFESNSPFLVVLYLTAGRERGILGDIYEAVSLWATRPIWHFYLCFGHVRFRILLIYSERKVWIFPYQRIREPIRSTRRSQSIRFYNAIRVPEMQEKRGLPYSPFYRFQSNVPMHEIERTLCSGDISTSWENLWFRLYDRTIPFPCVTWKTT